MNDTDRPRVAQMLAVLSELYAEPMSEPRAEAYFRALEDLDWLAVEQAGLRAMRECKFFPRPAELREFAEGSLEDRAQRAWEQIHEAMRRAGSYVSAWVDDPATSRALIATFGGWVEFGGMALEPPMQTAKRKEFHASYRAALQRADPVAHYHAGQYERNNREQVGRWNRGPQLATFDQQVVRLFADGRVAMEYATFSALTGGCVEPLALPAEPQKALPAEAERLTRRARGEFVKT